MRFNSTVNTFTGALLVLATLAPILSIHAADATSPYRDWKHSGSLFILTTPDGADLPATALEENFPVLVRLNKEFFDFSQAQSNGTDIRFQSSEGRALAFQIDEWDAIRGVASVWVRIPFIKGNARQELKMFWGKADAVSESNGASVFNAENGFVAVMHLNENLKDEVGTLKSVDHGTTEVDGNIGRARRFSEGKGINCGEKLTGLPSGSDPHTSEVWFKAEVPNALALAWGNEQGQGKVTLRIASPPHIQMECYFSGADLHCDNALLMKQWVHVVHTYRKGDSRVYVNGRLEGVSERPNSPLAIKNPARMFLGGWYGTYHFVGDIDEVRLSKVVRSPDWIKMEFENQKALNTLVGPLVRSGNAFSVSTESLTIDEGQHETITAQAGGAQKYYWILKKGPTESIVAVDTLSYSLGAGRVTVDTPLVLQFKAVFPNATRAKDINVTIKEAVPEPVFTLQAPANWNGRDDIDVVPKISNFEALKAKGVDDLHYKWSVYGGATIKEIAANKLILKRSQCSGTITVKALVNNGGADVEATTTIHVTEPARDAWVQRQPEKDEKPEDGQFYARDDQNEGTLNYNGALEQSADVVFLKLYANDVLLKNDVQKLSADRHYVFTAKLKPGLIHYKVEFGTKTGEVETILHSVSNIVCGDAFLIEGQSNALATDTRENSPAETHEWIRSYGSPSDAKGTYQNLWCNPVWKARKGEKAELGYWGMELAKRLVAENKVPVFIINAAVGGTRIDQHQRNEQNPTDLKTIYGRMLWRIQHARMTHGIRAVVWHQGEADQGSDGPDGGYGWENYQNYFVEMTAGWKRDIPNIQHYYLFQIWPNACSQGNGHGDMLREIQRTLPKLYSNMSIMSTLGIKPSGGCHYPLTGWAEFARLLEPLIERDIYGKQPDKSITPPNLIKASFANAAKNTITLEFDQPVVWDDTLTKQFYLDGTLDKVASGSGAGAIITLKLKAPSAAQKISYLRETSWSQDRLIFGANGIAALTFCEVPIESSK